VVVNRFEFSGPRLRAVRESAGLTRELLAARIDRSPQLVALYELGYRQPPAPMLVALAGVLGVHVEDFFEDVSAVHA
jgi:transcriptional regulator with XRE-family HTH domain